ncbi:LysE/ArgO family amino acid transporter [Pelagovum pacificum]|uniref:Amino acid transporter n=1 Tax=Pelagovum pacificum TaxID=2588711 RepID=A0A5C5GLW1_9RHOB|nr:LysE/ArgO family amino acid transporter [Pelagovum pacificum]QQA44951.1 amino acid transporter [Pelagovum pacificum]TNY34286.1 amino acid transporter [Pelagovum pacificum]
MLGPALTGFLTGFSLILAIGAQNAFVLRQGLLRTHVFELCLLCALSDALLITAGVAGFGAITAALPMLPTIMTLGGAAFLLVYGALRLKAAWDGDYHMTLTGGSAPLAATLATGAAFTWLNPHVYLDTLGLVGAVSTQYEALGPKTAFGIGAVTASFVFFFSLGYGARLLAPVMTSARAWRWLDIGIGIVMWALAAKLLLS